MTGKSKNILSTFDYELFLGINSGAVNKCLIEPTEKILTFFGKHNLKCMFFVDTVYLLRMEEMAITNSDCFKDLNLIYAQLMKIAAKGHYIFPHIHAHWLDAEYLDDQKNWSLTNYRYYTFASVPDNIKEDIFKRSVNIIQRIVNPLIQDYTIDCYRAGGWCIQPFPAFKKFFIEYGIVNDFSVMPGKYLKSNAHEFDFRKAPLKDTYLFDDDIVVEDTDGRFKEWTISIISLSRIENLIIGKINTLLYILKLRAKNRGSTVNSSVFEDIDIYALPNMGKRVPASFEGLNLYFVWKYLVAVRKKKFFQFISHPKLLTNKDFIILRILLFFITKFYKVNSDYKTQFIIDD